ncbi:terminase small subunit [Hymenobacter bucti]|uniref:Terminase small subunit n=1 Tax=Hymenobacter bucti TaxID=1844114 RepID=A0ABW4QY46_9BACT
MSTAARKPATPKLDAKHKRFVGAFCGDPSLNATRAAIAAGYSAKTAAQQASRLLRNVKVRDAIEQALAKAAMGTEEIASHWSAVGRVNLSDFFTKVEYEETTKVHRPLIEWIAELEYQYSFENRVASRQVLDEKQLLAHSLRQNDRRNTIIWLQVELEMNPAATYQADGPAVKRHRMELDLVKADELGVLDLAKSIKPTAFGTAIELPDRLAALERLAKWQGMFVDKVEHSGSMGIVWEEVKTYEGKGAEVA